MRRQGFSDTAGYRALNPTAVFGENRDLYYERLEDADSSNLNLSFAGRLMSWKVY
jgi:hypothetical protein